MTLRNVSEHAIVIPVISDSYANLIGDSLRGVFGNANRLLHRHLKWYYCDPDDGYKYDLVSVIDQNCRSSVATGQQLVTMTLDQFDAFMQIAQTHLININNVKRDVDGATFNFNWLPNGQSDNQALVAEMTLHFDPLYVYTTKRASLVTPPRTLQVALMCLDQVLSNGKGR